MKPYGAVALALLITACVAQKQTPAKPDSRREIAIKRADFENKLVRQERFQGFDVLGSMALGPPSSALYCPFGVSDRRFVLINFGTHCELLYQKLVKALPKTVWQAKLIDAGHSAAPKTGSLPRSLHRDGYRVPTSQMPQEIKAELDADRGYSCYALMSVVDTLVVWSIRRDGTESSSETISPNTLRSKQPILPITKEESAHLGFGKTYWLGPGEFSIHGMSGG
jgi:hypothetical protein